MILVLAVVNLALIAWLSVRGWKKSGQGDTVVYWSSLSFRLVCGLAVGLTYKYYYHNSGDTFTFFSDAANLAQYAYHDPGAWLSFLVTGDSPVPLVTTEPRSVFFVAILSVVNVATANNYWISSLWFSLFSFWCAYRLVRKIDQEFTMLGLAARIAFLFVPSIVFWSAGIIKESLAVAAIAILVIHFLSIMRDQRLPWHAYAEIMISLYLVVSLKYYWAAVLLPSMVTSLILHWAFRKRAISPWVLAGAWLVVFALLSVLASFTHPNFYLSRFLSVIIENHDTYLSISRPGSTIGYYDLSKSWFSILINSPWALWSGLFRPMIFEASSMTSVLAAIENLVMLVLVIWKLRDIHVPASSNRLIVMAALVFIGVLCIFLALSTPNLGTLSRYRVGFLPFFVLLTLADHPVNAWISTKQRTSKD